MTLEDMFRAYDIRGKTDDELTADVMRKIGQAFATDSDADTVIVGHDVRETSPELSIAFAEGANAAGMNVLDKGFLPYGPVLFAGWRHRLPTAYVTASHLPEGWNGVKFAHGTGIGYTEEENVAVKDMFFAEEFDAGEGEMEHASVTQDYIDHVTRNVDVKDVEVLMDCGNGSSTAIAPELFGHAGVTPEVINGEPDGSFPNRESDVTEESLEELRQRIANEAFDMGVAYDGDADRVAVVDDEGRLLSAEQLAAILLQQILEEQEGPVVANVECSRLLEHVAEQYGTDVIRVRVGHTYLFKAMQENDAVLGVEKSGHMGVPHVLPLDDGIATSLYAAEVVSKLDEPLSQVVDDLPFYHRDRFAYEVPDSEKFDIIADLQDRLADEYEDTNTMDGIRVELDKGWILIRASNTSPKIRLTVEAETHGAFEELRDRFSAVLEDALK